MIENRGVYVLGGGWFLLEYERVNQGDQGAIELANSYSGRVIGFQIIDKTLQKR